jgi:hypothetical protein
LYVDDLNHLKTKDELKTLLKAQAPSEFYPWDATWIKCQSTTYRPHSNECGPRTLFALMVMALHPQPSPNILLPYMSPNLAQILRTWVAFVLITGSAPVPEWNMGQQHIYLNHQGSSSQPAYLFPWDSEQFPFTVVSNQSILATKVSPPTHPLPAESSNDPHFGKPQIQSDTQPTARSLGIQLTLHGVFHLPPTASSDQGYDDVLGHYPSQIDDKKKLRIVFSNPRGLKFSSDIMETEYSLGRCQALGVGAICLAESNINWGNHHAQGTFHGMLRKIWRHTKTSKSYTKEDFESEKQPGGTVTMVCNHWTSRVIEAGVDPFGLGRWSYMVLRGKGNIKILIITTYRVCKQAVQSVGPETSRAQQFRLLSKQFRAEDRLDSPIPRHQFIIDLKGWIEHKEEKGIKIILGIDANEPFDTSTGIYTPVEFTTDRPIPITGHDGTLATLVRTCGLQVPLLLHHSEAPPPPTYDRGQEKIDFLFVSTCLVPSVTHTGIFPYNSLFVSDHRPCFIDMDGDAIFKENTPVIMLPYYRGLRLRLHDPPLVHQYTETLMTQINYHKISEKSEALLNAANSGSWTDTDTEMYEKLDKLLNEAMLKAK